MLVRTVMSRARLPNHYWRQANLAGLYYNKLMLLCNQCNTLRSTNTYFDTTYLHFHVCIKGHNYIYTRRMDAIG